MTLTATDSTQCPMCRKVRPPVRVATTVYDGHVSRRVFGAQDMSEPFCSVKCALEYARRAYALLGATEK